MRRLRWGVLSAIGLLGFLSGTIGADSKDQHIGPITDIAVAGGAVYSCSQGGVFCEPQDNEGDERQLLFRAPFRVMSIAAGPVKEGQPSFLMAGGGDPGASGLIGIYRFETGEFSFVNVADDLVYSVAVSPSGELGAAACADNRVLTVPIAGFVSASPESRHFHTGAARVVRFSPDGNWLASAGLDGAVLVSPSATKADHGSPPRVLQDHSDKVDSLAFSPDSSRVASGARDGRVRVHTVADGRLVRTYQGLGETEEGVTASVLALAWGGSPEAIVAGTSGGEVYLLSTGDDRWTRIERVKSGPVNSLAFTGSPGQVRVGTNEVNVVAVGEIE